MEGNGSQPLVVTCYTFFSVTHQTKLVPVRYIPLFRRKTQSEFRHASSLLFCTQENRCFFLYWRCWPMCSPQATVSTPVFFQTFTFVAPFHLPRRNCIHIWATSWCPT